MKVTKSLCLTLAGMLIVGALMSACSHEPAKGIPEKSESMGPRPWEPLYGVAIHSGTWFIVGARGVLLTTADQGKTWHRRSIIDRDFYSIRFSPSGKQAWITGEDGLIFISDDDGKTWKQQKSGTEDRLLKIGIVDDQRAAIAGSDGTMLYTADGGKTWTSQKFKDITFFDIAMNSKGEGWAVGEFETILHTTDGGKTWQVQKGGVTRDFRVGPYFAVDFEPNSQDGFVVGLQGTVQTTADGGKSWHDTKLPINRAMYVAVGADKSLWMAGADGTLISAKTNQQQLADWKVENPTFNDIADLAVEDGVQVAVGLNGTVIVSHDGGVHWQPIVDVR